jgi:multiple antibiotic resistance protein
MAEWLGTFSKLLLSLFAIMNPVGAAIFLVSVTPGESPEVRRKIARVASLAVVVVLAVAGFAGEAILEFFGIGIPSFRVIGGILLLLTAIEMLNVRPRRSQATPEERNEAMDSTEIGVVPLAIPLMAGPGAISLVLLSVESARGAGGMAAVALAVLCIGGVIWGVLSLGPRLQQLIGRTGENILTRLMGLIVGAIAVEFIIGGVGKLLPGLTGN